MVDSIPRWWKVLYHITNKTTKEKHKALRIIGDCEKCGNAMEFFLGEIPRLCPNCQNKISSKIFTKSMKISRRGK